MGRPREIQYIVDQFTHAPGAAARALPKPAILCVGSSRQDLSRSADSRKGVAKVVTEHGDELFPQGCGFPLRKHFTLCHLRSMAKLSKADLEAFTAIAETARQEAVTLSARRGTSTSPPRMAFFNVALNSRGGNVWVAMSNGRIIRQYAFSTRVEVGATCVSTCLYLLAAGKDDTLAVASAFIAPTFETTG